MLRAPGAKVYQADFDRFRLFGPQSDCFGVFKVTDGLLFGDCASLLDLRFMLDNKVGLVVSFSSIYKTWEPAGVEYLVLESIDKLDAARAICQRADKLAGQTVLVACSRQEEATKALLHVACMLVLRFRWTMTVATEFVRSAVQVEGSIFSEDSARTMRVAIEEQLQRSQF